MNVDDLKEIINLAIYEVQNSEDGVMCSEEGVRQIFAYIIGIISEFKISQYDYSFEYGR